MEEWTMFVIECSNDVGVTINDLQNTKCFFRTDDETIDGPSTEYSDRYTLADFFVKLKDNERALAKLKAEVKEELSDENKELKIRCDDYSKWVKELQARIDEQRKRLDAFELIIKPKGSTRCPAVQL